MKLLGILCIVTVMWVALSQPINCEQPFNMLEEEVCTTRSIIGLYQQKLQILEKLHATSEKRSNQDSQNTATATNQQTIKAPEKRNRATGSASQHIGSNQLIPKKSNVNYSMDCQFVPPNYILSDGVLYDINGKQIETVKGRVINIDNNGEFTTLMGRQVNLVSVKNGKLHQELWGIQKDYNPTQWILIRGQKTIVQHYASTVVFTSKTFTKEVFTNSPILSLAKHFPNQFLFISSRDYGFINLKDFSVKTNTYPKLIDLKTITSSSLPEGNQIALIVEDRYLHMMNIGTNQIINHRDLNSFSTRYSLKNMKLSLHRGLVFVWSSHSEYLLAFNTSTNGALELVWTQRMCLQNDFKPTTGDFYGYNFKSRTSGNSIYLVFTCGQTSSLYEIPLPEAVEANLLSKWIHYAVIAIAIAGVFVYKKLSKDKQEREKRRDVRQPAKKNQ